MFHKDIEFKDLEKKCDRHNQNFRLDFNLQERFQTHNKFTKENYYSSSLEVIMRGTYSNSMKHEVIEKVLKPIIHQNPAFNLFHDNTLLILSESLQFCVAIPNEYVFAACDITTKVYIVRSGLIRIFNKKESTELSLL